MKTETWLPILTLGLGWGLAQLTEVLKDRRASNRERQARQAELQRATLLSLQDALLELSNLAGDANLALFAITLEDARDHANPAAKRKAEEDERQARHRVWEATAKTELLLSRVQDQRARNEATLLVHTVDMVATSDKEASDEALADLHGRYTKVIRRLGELIRERY
jgi:hypothetical protein